MASELSSLIDKQMRSYDDVEKGNFKGKVSRRQSQHGETLLKAFARQRRMLLVALVSLTVALAMYTAFSGMGSFEPKEIVFVEAEQVNRNGDITQVTFEVHGNAQELDRVIEREEQRMEEEAARTADVSEIDSVNADDAAVEEELREEMEEQAAVIEQVLNNNADDTNDAVTAATEAAVEAEIVAELQAEENAIKAELQADENAINVEITKAMEDGSAAQVAEELATLEQEVNTEASSQQKSSVEAAIERQIEAEQELEEELSGLEAAKVPGGEFTANQGEPTLLEDIEQQVFGDEPSSSEAASEATALDSLLAEQDNTLPAVEAASLDNLLASGEEDQTPAQTMREDLKELEAELEEMAGDGP